METPSSVMYADLKAFGRLPYRQAAGILLGRGDTAIAARVQDRTFLSREIVHARPGSPASDAYADIADATLSLGARIVAARVACGAASDERDARAQLLERYRGPSAEAMARALDACDLPGTVYLNARDKLAQASFTGATELGTLHLMLFVATGCLGDPAAAARVVEGFITGKLAADLHTTETNVGIGAARDGGSGAGAGEGGAPVIGLLRIVDGLAKEPLHRLSTDPVGTIVGALAAGPGCISDVDRDVSRRHLRVWRDPGTLAWLAQGLGSTNGTIVISGEDRSVRVIEPPRRGRERGREYPPVPILASDMLCLGATTRFLVVQMVE